MIPDPAAPEPAGDTVRSPGAALGWSIVGTTLGYASLAAGLEVGAVGVIVGPSLGHFYTRDARGSLIGIGLRTAGAAMIVYGIARSFDDSDDVEDSSGLPMIPIGMATAIGGTIYSLVDAPGSARRANARERQLIVTPAPVRGPEGSVGFGAQLDLRF